MPQHPKNSATFIRFSLPSFNLLEAQKAEMEVPFLGWGSVPPNQPGIIPTKKKIWRYGIFPGFRWGRTSWAKNVSFWEGIYHPSLLGVGDFSNSTGMGSGRGTWGAGDVAIPKVSRDASPTETTGNTFDHQEMFRYLKCSYCLWGVGFTVLPYIGRMKNGLYRWGIPPF